MPAIYCFARPTHTYLDFNTGRDFEREIVVKVNVPEVLRTELARPSWKGEHVALGTNTDPYQWVEGRYKLMRGIWEAIRDFANPCSVLTKSPLLLRDLDLLLQIAEVAPVSANLSVPTLDEKAWRATEPHTPNPRARLEAVAELNRAGIPTGVLIAPLMPGINDVARAGRAHPRAGHGGGRHQRGRHRAPPPRRGAQASSSTGCAHTGPTLCRATSASTRVGPMRHLPSASASRTSPHRRDDRHHRGVSCAIATWSAPRRSGRSGRPRPRPSPRSGHCSDGGAGPLAHPAHRCFAASVRRKRQTQGAGQGRTPRVR